MITINSIGFISVKTSGATPRQTYKLAYQVARIIKNDYYISYVSNNDIIISFNSHNVSVDDILTKLVKFSIDEDITFFHNVNNEYNEYIYISINKDGIMFKITHRNVTKFWYQNSSHTFSGVKDMKISEIYEKFDTLCIYMDDSCTNAKNVCDEFLTILDKLD